MKFCLIQQLQTSDEHNSAKPNYLLLVQDMATSHAKAEGTYTLFHSIGSGSVLPLVYVWPPYLETAASINYSTDATSWRTSRSCDA